MAQTYVILNQQQIRSKHGGLITRITLVGTEDRLEYQTYIDPKNRNFKYWYHIVSKPNHGFVLKNCVKKKDNVISADCRPVIAWESEDPTDVFDELMSVWQTQDHQ